MSVKKLVSFLVFLSALLMATTAAAGVNVADPAQIFSHEQMKQLEAFHEAFLKTHDIDCRILTTKDFGDINITANRTFEQAQIGGNSKTKKGVLVVLNARKNVIKVKITPELRSVFTDEFISYIEYRLMFSFIKANNIASGIGAVTRIFYARAEDEAGGIGFDPNVIATGQSAVARMLGSNETLGDFIARITNNDSVAKPETLIAAYFDEMKKHNASPDLPLYSRETSAMLKELKTTNAQMDALVQTYAKCPVEGSSVSDMRAVVRFQSADRTCSPFFLVMEDGSWKLDLATMQKAIKFNTFNQWHFDLSVRHGYWFGFTRWGVDKDGFLIAKNAGRWGMYWQDKADLRKNQKGFCMVDSVDKGSFAASYRFLKYDVFLKFGDVVQPDCATLSDQIDRIPPGNPFLAVIQRDETAYTIKGRVPVRQ